jgi:hypothetical protein
MAMVYEPIKSWDIVYQYRVNGILFSDTFTTLKELREYFFKDPYKGHLVGYDIRKNISPPKDKSITEAQLFFMYEDKSVRGGNAFDNVFQMIKYFENPEHAALAKWWGMLKKQNRKAVSNIGTPQDTF